MDIREIVLKYFKDVKKAPNLLIWLVLTWGDVTSVYVPNEGTILYVGEAVLHAAWHFLNVTEHVALRKDLSKLCRRKLLTSKDDYNGFTLASIALQNGNNLQSLTVAFGFFQMFSTCIKVLDQA